MKGRILFSGLITVSFLASMAQAQVAQLGTMQAVGKVQQAGLFHRFIGGGGDSCCDAGCDGCPSCGLPEPGCGAAAPSCGLAGRILGGGASCGLPGPSCGSTGLGYSGGFGLCGDCDSCGVGGYIGRNIHQVNPCACGGSLIADMARGLLSLVDRAVGSVVGGFFGGLQAVTCHASGTFAALQCAAQASCYSCGGAGCDGGCPVGPACGAPGPGCGVATPEYGTPSYGTMSYPHGSAPAGDIYLSPAAPNMGSPPTMHSAPAQPQPVPAAPIDPFLDDAPPQVRQQMRPRPTGYRMHNARAQQVAQAGYRAQQRAPRIGTAVQNTMQNVRTATAQVAAPLQHRYLQSQTQRRAATLRR